MSASRWIGVDFDGTLARDDQRPFPEAGDPIMPMVDRVKRWLDSGEDVRILTARASCVRDPERPHMVPEVMCAAVHEFCEEWFGQRLVVTAEKDWLMRELWDDRCVQVVRNRGTRAITIPGGN